MSELRTIKRVVGSVDERLPLQEVIAISRKQADAMPLEITEQRIPYQVTDVKMHIKGTINTAIATYTEVK